MELRSCACLLPSSRCEMAKFGLESSSDSEASTSSRSVSPPPFKSKKSTKTRVSASSHDDSELESDAAPPRASLMRSDDSDDQESDESAVESSRRSPSFALEHSASPAPWQATPRRAPPARATPSAAKSNNTVPWPKTLGLESKRVQLMQASFFQQSNSTSSEGDRKLSSNIIPTTKSIPPKPTPAFPSPPVSHSLALSYYPAYSLRSPTAATVTFQRCDSRPRSTSSLSTLHPRPARSVTHRQQGGIIRRLGTGQREVVSNRLGSARGNYSYWCIVRSGGAGAIGCYHHRQTATSRLSYRTLTLLPSCFLTDEIGCSGFRISDDSAYAATPTRPYSNLLRIRILYSLPRSPSRIPLPPLHEITFADRSFTGSTALATRTCPLR